MTFLETINQIDIDSRCKDRTFRNNLLTLTKEWKEKDGKDLIKNILELDKKIVNDREFRLAVRKEVKKGSEN